jgi:hypothetical protein
MRAFHFLFLSLPLLISACASRGDFQGFGVNPFLWRAAIETISFIPLASAEPQGGLLITEWQEQQSNERIKLTISVLTSDLRADGIKVAVFRQARKGGRWVDAPVSRKTALEIENLILTKARALRLGFVQ